MTIPCPFCNAQTKSSSPAFYNCINTSTPRPPGGSTGVPASVHSVRASTTPGALDEIHRALLRLHLRLAGELSAVDYTLLDRITFDRISQVAPDNKSGQCCKFQRLLRALQADINKRTVINLSSDPLEDVA